MSDELPIKPIQTINTPGNLEKDEILEVEEDRKFDIKKLSQSIGFTNLEALMKVIHSLISKTKNLEKHLSKNESEFLMLSILEEFVLHLEEQKIINSNDVAVLFDNPKIITHLDGFKSFMKSYMLHGLKEDT